MQISHASFLVPCSQKPHTLDATFEFYLTTCKFAIKLHQVFWLHQIASSLWKSELLQPDIRRLAARCWNNLHQAGFDSQLATSLLTTCSKLHQSGTSDGNKPAADLLQLERFWWIHKSSCVLSTPITHSCNLSSIAVQGTAVYNSLFAHFAFIAQLHKRLL